MDEAKTQLADRLKKANNVLVTVSRNPSVDQLAALLGLGLFLNKQGKHSAAVFSGKIPSTLEFLKPESTIQKNTDSLRDFIIALDKSKADKLRYKVEDNIVRIFITPYRNSIGQDDLEFSQGDFNVDVIVALGVAEQTDIDDAITAHGRILHDATVASINVNATAQLGTINWNDADASSLCELVTNLIQLMDPDNLDEQIATALLTGIVATTDRFSNDKTSAKTMSTSSALMSAGANQQLVATQLEETPSASLADEKPELDEAEEPATVSADGTLEIDHEASEEPEKETEPEAPIELPTPEEVPAPLEETANPDPEPKLMPPSGLVGGPKLVTEPPTLGGTLTANSSQNNLEPTTDPMSLPDTEPPQLLSRKTNNIASEPPAPEPLTPLNTLPQLTPPADAGVASGVNIPPSLGPPPADWTAPPAVPDSTQVHIDENGTLRQLEEAVHSPHVNDTDAAREEVDKALKGSENLSPPPPIEALNAQPLGGDLHPSEPFASMDSPVPPPMTQPTIQTDQDNSQGPPPVPPPLGFGN